MRGAEPGDVLQVDILDLRFRMDWGFVAILPLLGTLPDEFTDYETIHPDIDVARGVAVLPWGTELPLDPFFGIMAPLPPPPGAGSEPRSARVRREHGQQGAQGRHHPVPAGL